MEGVEDEGEGDVVDDVGFLAVGALAHGANRADIAALGDTAASISSRCRFIA